MENSQYSQLPGWIKQIYQNHGYLSVLSEWDALEKGVRIIL